MEKCEICKQEIDMSESINIGLNIGYQIGNYATGEMEYDIKPQLIRISSIYLCRGCKKKLKNKEFLNINVLPKIKEYLTDGLMRGLIIEELKK